MLKTRRSFSPISSAKSAAPPVHPVASHTTTIAIHPDAIHPLTSFCNLVAGDNLTDGPERMALVTGKGTVLLKANSDVRPIVTEEPLWHYVGYLLARTFRPTIQTVSVYAFIWWL